MQHIPLDLLVDYARCPLMYWWRRRAHIEAPPTAESLPERVLRGGLTEYYEGRATNVLNGCLTIWREWLAEWGCPPGTIDHLREYVEIDADLLAASIRKSDDTPYPDPRPTQHYEEQARAAGLPELGRELEQALNEAPLVVTGEYDPLRALGDSILMALLYKGPERDPDGGTHLHYPFEVPVTDGITVTGAADLVVIDGKRVEIAEVHDYGPHCPPTPALSRHLVIIALACANGERWRGDPATVYRHMLTGFSTHVYQVECPERLLPVIAAALRGVQCGVFLPRIATAERDCLNCDYYGLCVTEDGLDVLDDLDATLVALGRSHTRQQRQQEG